MTGIHATVQRVKIDESNWQKPGSWTLILSALPQKDDEFKIGDEWFTVRRVRHHYDLETQEHTVVIGVRDFVEDE